MTWGNSCLYKVTRGNSKVDYKINNGYTIKANTTIR